MLVSYLGIRALGPQQSSADLRSEVVTRFDPHSHSVLLGSTYVLWTDVYLDAAD